MTHPDPYRDATARATQAAASGDWQDAARWWDRAWRLADKHVLPGLHLAGALRSLGDPACIDLLQRLPRHRRLFAAALPLSAALLQAGRAGEAAAVLAELLGHTALGPIAPLHAVAREAARSARLPGWLGWRDGALFMGAASGQSLDPARLSLRLGRKPLALAWTEQAPGLWSAPFAPDAAGPAPLRASPALLGAPFHPAALRQIEGVATLEPDGLRIVACHPSDPDRPPRLSVTFLGPHPTRALLLDANRPLDPDPAWPLERLWQAELPIPPDTAEIRIRSPLDGRDLPGSPLRLAADPPPRRPNRRRRQAPAVAAILALPPGAPPHPPVPGANRTLLVQNGGTRPRDSAAAGPDRLVAPQAPGLAACLNLGAQAADPMDLLLLAPAAPPDPDALPALRSAAGPDGVGIPPAPITALFVPRRCFDALGGLREATFATAEAALADFAARAAAAGWPVRQAAATLPAPPPQTPAASAAATADASRLRTLAPAWTTPPGPDPALAAQLLRGRRATLLITHPDGGGVERHVRERAAAITASGGACAILRSCRDHPADLVLQLDARPDLRFRLPQDEAALLACARAAEFGHIEIHHLHRHPDLTRTLPAALGVPYTMVLHDYALVCPRVTLLGAAGTFCRQPDDSACQGCATAFALAENEPPASIRALRQSSLALLEGAARILAPSQAVAPYFARYYPWLNIDVSPWEVVHHAVSSCRRSEAVEVCIVGALNHAKGLGVLLDCVRDASSRHLPLHFTVVGFTEDDPALIEAGAFVTGRFAEDERAALIARTFPAVGFLPSIWPEPWCYALTGLLEAGLPVACFDLGAQAERVRAAGGALLPLGSPAAAINQRLLALAA